MVILYHSYDINKLKGSVNSGSPFTYYIIIKNNAMLEIVLPTNATIFNQC